ncbi:MAG TPA: hypothetical protein VIA18_19955 [Polyangia bacterium]|jgi:hypothetical protein|nr:hypothetical protein [Polyangia bacterium]HWE29209.1 hypothetical protein [Polyangia bacterium]
MASSSGYELKCWTVRAHLSQAANLSAFPDVLAKLPSETRRALEALPLPAAWVDGRMLQDLLEAVHVVCGIDAARQVSLRAQESSIGPLLMPIVSGLLRVFGAKPNSLLSRFSDLTRTQLRGIALRWVLDSPGKGRLVATFPQGGNRRAAFIGFETSCEYMLRLCRVDGTVSPTEISDDGKVGTIRVEWDA